MLRNTETLQLMILQIRVWYGISRKTNNFKYIMICTYVVNCINIYSNSTTKLARNKIQGCKCGYKQKCTIHKVIIVLHEFKDSFQSKGNQL